MIRSARPVLALTGAALAGAAWSGSAAMADPPVLTFYVQDAGHAFTPLHSAVHGEESHDILFFTGVSGQGLHSLPEGSGTVFVELDNYNTNVVLADPGTGTVLTAPTDHLSEPLRVALRVSNAVAKQIGSTLYIYGGYGPLWHYDVTLGEDVIDDFTTRATVTAVDLAAVRSAILASAPVPETAFTILPSAHAQVAGARIIDLGSTYALLGGSNFTGDYGGTTETFTNVYAQSVKVFDPGVSVTTAATILTAPNSPTGPNELRRRDMSAVPVLLPDGGGGFMPGFAICGGVFKAGFQVWKNPLTYRAGDPEIAVGGAGFEQKMNVYEGPSASFFSDSEEHNRIVLFSGISPNRWNGASFVPDGLAPWTPQITEIRMAAASYTAEYVIGEMPNPVTNAELVLESNIPTTSTGQVLIDEMPANIVRLGRIYGGLRASGTGHSPVFGGAVSTFASGSVWDVMVVVGVRGDINRDGETNTADLGLLISQFGSTGLADLNLDGTVNTADLGLLLASFGNNTPG